MKKTIAFILAMAMICSVVPAFAVGDTEKTVAQAVYYGYDDVGKAWNLSLVKKVTKEGSCDATTLQLDPTTSDVKRFLLAKDDVLKYDIKEAENRSSNNVRIKGKYEIRYLFLAGDRYAQENADKMAFTIVHNNMQSKVVVDQKYDPVEDPKNKEKILQKWVRLGYFEFSGEGDEYIIHQNDSTMKTYITTLALFPVDGKESEEHVDGELIEEIPLDVYKDGVHPQIVKEYTTASGSQTSSAPATLTGEWEVSKTPDSVWITPSKDGKVETVTYTPEFGYSIPGESCKADVYAHVLAGYGDVTYTIKDAKYTLQPQKITKDQWVYLGNYDFSDGSSVILSAASDENISASTVMFETDGTKRQCVTPVYVGREQENPTQDKNPTQDIFIDMVEGDGDHWAKTDVEYMASKKMINGVKDKYFDPNARITRAEYITILDRALGFEELSPDEKKVEVQPYDDVILNAWYAPYINYAKANGLTEGLPVDDGFKPNQPITREEMGLFTYNAIKQTGKTGTWKEGYNKDPWNSFTDIEHNKEDENSGVSPWAKDGLRYLVREEIIKGTSDTTISPKDSATRAQAAVILKRFMEKYIWAGATGELKFNKEFGDLDGWNSSAENMNVSINENTLQFEVKKTTAAKGSYRSTESTKGCTYWEVRCKVSVPTDAIASFGLVDASGKEVLVNEWHPFDKVQFHCYVPAQDNAKSLSVKPESDLSDAYHTFGFKLSKDAKTIFYYMDGKEIGKKTLEGNELLETDLYPQISVEYKGKAEGNTTENAEKTVLMVDHVRAW